MYTDYNNHWFSDMRVMHHIENSGDPNWDTRLNFASIIISWQYIDVSMSDTSDSDNDIISPQLYSMNAGHHNRKLCNNNKINAT